MTSSRWDGPEARQASYEWMANMTDSTPRDFDPDLFVKFNVLDKRYALLGKVLPILATAFPLWVVAGKETSFDLSIAIAIGLTGVGHVAQAIKTSEQKTELERQRETLDQADVTIGLQATEIAELKSTIEKREDRISALETTIGERDQTITRVMSDNESDVSQDRLAE